MTVKTADRYRGISILPEVDQYQLQTSEYSRFSPLTSMEKAPSVVAREFIIYFLYADTLTQEPNLQISCIARLKIRWFI